MEFEGSLNDRLKSILKFDYTSNKKTDESHLNTGINVVFALTRSRLAHAGTSKKGNRVSVAGIFDYNGKLFLSQKEYK